MSLTLPVGLTLNPKIMLFSLALASATSFSVIPPTPELMISIFVSSVFIFSSEPFMASSEPPTSALIIIGKLLRAPSAIIELRSSSVTLVDFDNSLCLKYSALFFAYSLAILSLATLTNFSPANGTALKPINTTGSPGLASLTGFPSSFINAFILPCAIPATTVSPTLKVPF